MPYIKQETREFISRNFKEPCNAGELNFYITKAITAYLGDSPSYSDYNSVIGVLECAKLELYRRLVAPYEDKKCQENGDVYK